MSIDNNDKNDKNDGDANKLKLENEELKHKLAHMSMSFEEAKKETNYYFDKLQRLNMLKQDQYKNLKNDELLKIINDVLFN